jgi:hypothetical protein
MQAYVANRRVLKRSINVAILFVFTLNLWTRDYVPYRQCDATCGEIGVPNDTNSVGRTAPHRPVFGDDFFVKISTAVSASFNPAPLLRHPLTSPNSLLSFCPSYFLTSFSFLPLPTLLPISLYFLGLYHSYYHRHVPHY